MDSPITAAGIRRYFKTLDEHMKKLKLYGDEESINTLAAMRDEFLTMLNAAGIDKHGKGTTAIPKNLAAALKQLAGSQQIESIQAEVEAMLAQLDAQPDLEEMPRVDFEATPRVDWKEGVEHLKDLTLNDLWRKLGLPTDALVFFQERTDPTATIDPWTPEGIEWLQTNPLAEALMPRWHQLVSILFLVDCMLKGNPVLLMDEVGVGKTMQAIGLIAIRAFFYDHFASKGKFPGIFGSSDAKGNLKDAPSVIVCPPTMLDQFTAEIHRYLRPGTFDLLPYVSTYETRPQWWQKIWLKSAQRPRRRILLASHTALVSDAGVAFETEKYGPTPPKAKNWDSKKNTTIYGQEWGVCILDEAHCARKYNSSYNATRGLREASLMTVALTATPIMTKPAVRLKLTNALRGIMRGQKKSESEAAQEYMDVVMKWMTVMRDRFTGYVVRRTVMSTDNTGKPISGLEPFTEHNIILNLYQWELDNLDVEASELAEEHGGAVLYGAGKVSSRASLDALAHILQYHLAEDGRQPLKADAEGRGVEPDPAYDTQPVTDLPDKIVVYSAFPASNEIICDIFKLFGIQYLELNGKTPMNRRQGIIKQFQAADRDGPRVLILSGVGSDTLWSALEDDQLKGRVWRQPQRKKVRVYRLIADKTPDVFLNNISFDKGAMHEAFVGSTVHLSEFSTSVIALVQPLTVY
ncbi:hypothetical protein BV22DRAFT_1026655 [Leucogyrophana mollusca]|uniref:Uncharacterized protein n=1 Tax=Leucogyrophana mollusca TaxID=85980 RepID=A0ACB8AXK7_9AGAM|nr:hypothetical protein BV22DRAFT_1026655 [Leucogyrophana mollusca]